MPDGELSLAMQPDVGLTVRLEAGNLDALGELYDRVGPFAFAYALKLAGDREAATAAVERGFSELWRNARRRGAVGTRPAAKVVELVGRAARELRPTAPTVPATMPVGALAHAPQADPP